MTTTTIYRITFTNGSGAEGREYDSRDEAELAVMAAMGWSSITCSESFAVGSCEGKRGSVYGVECYETREECDAATDGNPHAPRIIIIRGDEAFAMGRV